MEHTGRSPPVADVTAGQTDKGGIQFAQVVLRSLLRPAGGWGVPVGVIWRLECVCANFMRCSLPGWGQSPP